MRQYILVFAVFALFVFFLGGCGGSGEESSAAAPEISGRIEGGLRVLTFDPGAGSQDFRIYRGDYVRPEVVDGGTIHLVIEDLAVDSTYPAPEGVKPYFKVPEVGTFTYQADSLQGTIEAIDYTSATYREVNAAEAEKLIRNVDPFILDVRTQREFDGGHLPGATLVPVQVLQQRIDELEEYKERSVFVYCRTGNRSTVAARMLIDRGFRQVINLRRGIVEWQRAGLDIQQ